MKESDLVLTRDTRLRSITRSSCVCDSCIDVKDRDLLLTQDIHLRPITRTSCVHDSCIYVQEHDLLASYGTPIFLHSFSPQRRRLAILNDDFDFKL